MKIVWVVPRDDETIVAEVVIAHLMQFVHQGVIEKWAVPDRIEIVEAIDKTSVGKIDEKKLRARYAR